MRFVLHRTWWTTLVTLMLGASPALAQNGTVKGTVQDHAGVAIAGAEVIVEGTLLHATADERGRYELAQVPAGARNVRARMIGYRTESKSVTVEAGATATADFHLEHEAIPQSGVEVVVGSRAKHSAAEELAVPVDVYDRDVLLRQGTTETSQVLQQLSPAINFPRQSVTDATDVVRPFTLRGLSPDHTLVLVNGLRRHPTAVVNTFAYGMPAGSSGVDLNAIPSSAIERVEVLRDGASAQYGSDAIAGVANVVLRRGRFAPFATLTGGSYFSADYPRDGETAQLSAGWGLGIGQGSLTLGAEVLDRQPTNRAADDPTDDPAVPQPNHHWGDGLEKDVLTMASWNLPLDDHSQLFAFGGYSRRLGNGNGYRRYAGDTRNWTDIYPLGFLPEFRPTSVDWSLAGGWKGSSSGWNLDAGASLGHNAFRYDLRNTLNTSLGPDLVNPTAPGPDGILGTADDPGIPNQTAFFAGELQRDELALTANASRELDLGLPAPVNTAFGAAWRRERWAILEGEKASWIDGGHLDSGGGDAPGGSQVFAGFSPTDASDNDRTNLGAYGDFETNLTPQLLVNGAARFEDYSDFGSLVTGKFAGRFQPDKHVTFRAAASTGFRAPGLSQMHFSKVVTNYIGGSPVDVGVFPVGHPAARALGAKDLKPEKSVNLSAGIVVSPVDEITVTLDAYRIDLKDRIVLGATFDDAASLGLLAAAGYTNVGGVQYFTNGLETRTTGLDLTAQWRVPMSGRDRTLTIDAAANYGRNEILDTATLPQVLVDAGSTETGQLDEVAVVAIEKERPDWRGTLTAEYTQGAARGLVRASYYGTFSSTQPAFTDGYTESYPARTLFDVEAGWKVAGAELALGARNLLDTYPGKPQLDYNNNFGLFPWAAASPFGYNGRYLYTRLTWTLPR